MRALGVVLAVAAMLPACMPAFAQDGVALRPRAFAVAPDDGDVAGDRPVFAIGFEGVAAGAVRDLRFRIELDPEADEGETLVFDQRRRRSGWGPGEEGEVLFRPPRPLPDGTYVWRPSIWNGVDWDAAGSPRRLRIDTVPPAWVETLTMTLEDDGRRVRLSWDPVTADLEGGPEFVTRYHVFRFEVGPRQPMVRPFEIAVVEAPGYVDENAPTGRAIVYYRVAAEDGAGNVTGQRR